MSSPRECLSCNEVKTIVAWGNCQKCWRRDYYVSKERTSDTYQKKSKQKYLDLKANYTPEQYKQWRDNAKFKKLKRLFGVDYTEMWLAQGGACAICGAWESGRALSLDHDHETGKARWLLCHNCNVIIGLAYESATVLNNAIRYLEQHR